MSLDLIQHRLAAYDCRSLIEEDYALREITQEVVLSSLGRSDFFEKAGFQGGSCLRIFHELNRFSEDLDFALTQREDSFSLSPYLDHLRVELADFGYDVEVQDKSKPGLAVQKAFVKDEGLSKALTLSFRPPNGPSKKLRVKIEVDTRPPSGASYETPFLSYPAETSIRVFDLPSLFAGKIHALLCREYIKGRDWYDFLWYTDQSISINHDLLSASLNQQGPWQGQISETDDHWVVDELGQKIRTIDWSKARRDVEKFLKPEEQAALELWVADYFSERCARIPQAPSSDAAG